jgi:hypothetical protein
MTSTKLLEARDIVGVARGERDAFGGGRRGDRQIDRASSPGRLVPLVGAALVVVVLVANRGAALRWRSLAASG